MVITPPAANDPDSSLRSRSAFHSGHRATSLQSRQIASGAAVVLMSCSLAHMSALPQWTLCPDHPRGGFLRPARPHPAAVVGSDVAACRGWGRAVALT